MRIIVVIISIAFSFLWYGCAYYTFNNPNNDKFAFVVDSIYFPLPDSSFKDKHIKVGQFIKLDGEEYFVALLANYHSSPYGIYFYHVKDRRLTHVIKTTSFAKRNFMVNSFYMFSKDSILLLLGSYNNRPFIKDTFIVLVDYNGNLKKAYPNNYSYATKKQWGENTLSYMAYNFYKHGYPNIYNYKLFFTMYPAYRSSPLAGTDLFFEKKLPLFGYYDLLEDSIVMSPYWFPELKKGNYYPTSGLYFNTNITMNNKNNPVVSFHYSSSVYEWNIKTNTFLPYRLASSYVDSILPDIDTSSNQFSDSAACYWGFYYDKLTGVYVRDLRFPSFLYGRFKHMLVFADKSFNYLGEVPNTYEFINRKIIFAPDMSMAGWEPVPFNQSEYSDSFKLVKKIYNFHAIDTNRLRNMIASEKAKYKKRMNKSICDVFDGEPNVNYSKTKLKKYLKNLCNIGDSSYALFVLSSKGCPDCNHEVLRFLSINRLVIFKKTATYVLLVDEKNGIENFFTDYPFLKNNKHVFIDTLNIYKKVNPYKNRFMYNPRLILMRNNKIVCDSIYPPDEITDGLLTKYLNFWSLDHE